MENLLHSNVTGDILKAFYKVYNALGYGFLEKVYENALSLELREMNYKVIQQKPINVYYRGALVGEYFADLIVADCVIVELKAKESINDAHISQLINYLKATEIEVGLLLNFGRKPEYKRKVFSNDGKRIERG
ncbi:MAG: GxxExxY protein [Acidobacteriota bacterium]|nr:GxxExxY protein [Acidobacteriota bacterium]